MEAVVKQTGMVMPQLRDLRGKVHNGLNRLFGCWHLQLTIPFTRNGETYRTCKACGARRRYDLDRWVLTGPFYYPDLKGGA